MQVQIRTMGNLVVDFMMSFVYLFVLVSISVWLLVSVFIIAIILVFVQKLLDPRLRFGSDVKHKSRKI